MKFAKHVCLSAALLVHASVHAASFDCHHGRSAAERTICSNADLSALDDQLGALFKSVRHHVRNWRAFVADSDSKWLWREHHCTDHECLIGWYGSRIAELRRQADALRSEHSGGAQTTGAYEPGGSRKPSQRLRTLPTGELGELGAPVCTAADPLPEPPMSCDRLIGRKPDWDAASVDRSHGWFCGVAMSVSSTAE